MTDSLKNLLAARFKKSPLAGRITASLVVEFINGQIKSLWGKKGMEQARAVSLKRQIAKIICENSIIAQELNFKKNSMIDSANDKFGEGTVKKVKIVQKGIENQAEEC